MSNDNKKRQSRQTNRRQLIQAAKVEWQEKAEALENLKADLGYQHVSWDEFMLILPDEKIDFATQSKIIELQTEYNEHHKNKALIWAEDNVVAELNKLHAMVNIEQTSILTEKTNALGYPDFSLQSKQSFKTYYENKTIMCLDNTERSKADIWIKSPDRREYNDIIFDPKSPGPKNGCYNMWRGFTRQAIKGSAELYWNHVRDNICNGNEESYWFLRRWTAYVFQKPDEVHTALVLCGSQGVGKNSFVDPLGILLGSHYAPLSSIHELVSNFNYHLKNAVLIHANEALWGGNRKEIGTVKAMITEKTCLIEGKGKDRIVVKNFKHVILSSNEPWPVHLDKDDRRFFVLNVSDKCKENQEYFGAIQNELNSGGYEALLYDLLNEDLTSFNPRQLPSTSDSFDIKIRSADSAHQYLYEVLCEGGFSIANDQTHEAPVWQNIIPKSSVYEDYGAWCQNNGEHRLSQAAFGKCIKKTIVTVKDTRPTEIGSGRRLRCYEFPSLQKAREEFSTAFKQKAEKIFNDEPVL